MKKPMKKENPFAKRLAKGETMRKGKKAPPQFGKKSPVRR